MMKSLFAVAGLLAMPIATGCQYIPGSSEALEREARTALDAALADGPSARFKDVKAVASHLDNKTPILCGLVNAKNRMNAYSGWRRFVIGRGTPSAIVSPDADDDSPRQLQAGQAAFEVVYSADRCPSSGYVPRGIVADAVRAAQPK